MGGDVGGGFCSVSQQGLSRGGVIFTAMLLKKKIKKANPQPKPGGSNVILGEACLFVFPAVRPLRCCLDGFFFKKSVVLDSN